MPTLSHEIVTFPAGYVLLPGHALGLKCIPPPSDDDRAAGIGRTYGGFPWPLTVGAEVIAPDWDDEPSCGNGLHVWAYAEGDPSVANSTDDEGSVWQVVDYIEAEHVNLDGKIKVPRCTVVAVGTGTSGRAACATLIMQACPGHRGNYGTATAGDSGTATAGYRGTATAGYSGTATAGHYGTIAIRYYDDKQGRYRVKYEEIDGKRLKAGVKYQVKAGRFVAVP